MPQAVLIGAPGSGKSSVGKALAKELATSFIDTDNVIESVANSSISQIFADHGEAYFREIEEEVVLGVLNSEPGVVALGGGSILSTKVQELLKNSSFLVIYLQVSSHQAIARVSKHGHRPILVGNPEENWKKLVADRSAIYSELSSLTFSTDSQKPADIAHQIALEITRR